MRCWPPVAAGCWHWLSWGPPGRLLCISAGLRACPAAVTWPEGSSLHQVGREGSKPLRSPSSGLGLAELPPVAQPQRGPATVTVTGVPPLPPRPHCCSAQHPSPPGLAQLVRPPIHRCLSLESGPSSPGYGGGAAPAQPAASRAPACCPPTTGLGDFVPRRRNFPTVLSAHSLACPSHPSPRLGRPLALPGVLSNSPFPGGRGRWGAGSQTGVCLWSL